MISLAQPSSGRAQPCARWAVLFLVLAACSLPSAGGPISELPGDDPGTFHPGVDSGVGEPDDEGDGDSDDGDNGDGDDAPAECPCGSPDGGDALTDGGVPDDASVEDAAVDASSFGSTDSGGP